MTRHLAPDPFRYDGYQIDSGRGVLHCHYAQGSNRFAERIEFGPGGDWDAPAVHAAARLVFLLAGVSYYKTAAPAVVDLGNTATSPAERGFLEHFYRAGLGEFALANRLDLSELEVVGPDVSGPQPRTAGRSSTRGPLVPFGGGIDSVVVAEEVRDRHPDTTLLVVGPPGARFAAIEHPAGVAGLAVHHVGREVDPEVRRSAERGFLNGHVPVTGILSAIAVTAAVLHGHDAVVMSNEWSASVGTRMVGDRSVNHQWSKSADFEDRFSAVLADAVGPVPAFFSLLRPYSELWVAERFSRLTSYHRAFRSCNRAFHLDPALRADRWCGRCDKCCFIDLILAPFLPAAELSAIFDGAEPLADPALAGRFAGLLGTAGDKPFECVGDIEECRVAVHAAAARPDRAATPLLTTLRADAPLPGPGGLEDAVDRLLRPMGPDRIPDRYRVPDDVAPASFLV